MSFSLSKNYKHDGSLLSVYKNALNDSSYTVETEGLNAIASVNKEGALKYARQLENTDEPDMLLGIASVYSQYGSDSNNTFFEKIAGQLTGFEPEVEYVSVYGQFLKQRSSNNTNVTNGVDIIANIYQHGSNRIAKFYARSALQQILAGYQDKEGVLNEQIAGLQKNNPNDTQITALQNKLSDDKVVEKRISNIIGQ